MIPCSNSILLITNEMCVKLDDDIIQIFYSTTVLGVLLLQFLSPISKANWLIVSIFQRDYLSYLKTTYLSKHAVFLLYRARQKHQGLLYKQLFFVVITALFMYIIVVSHSTKGLHSGEMKLCNNAIMQLLQEVLGSSSTLSCENTTRVSYSYECPKTNKSDQCQSKLIKHKGLFTQMKSFLMTISISDHV